MGQEEKLKGNTVRDRSEKEIKFNVPDTRLYFHVQQEMAVQSTPLPLQQRNCHNQQQTTIEALAKPSIILFCGWWMQVGTTLNVLLGHLRNDSWSSRQSRNCASPVKSLWSFLAWHCSLALSQSSYENIKISFHSDGMASFMSD